MSFADAASDLRVQEARERELVRRRRRRPEAARGGRELRRRNEAHGEDHRLIPQRPGRRVGLVPRGAAAVAIVRLQPERRHVLGADADG